MEPTFPKTVSQGPDSARGDRPKTPEVQRRDDRRAPVPDMGRPLEPGEPPEPDEGDDVPERIPRDPDERAPEKSPAR